MFLEQGNDCTSPSGPGEQPGDLNGPDQPDNDWAGEPFEGSGFEDENPEPGFEWRGIG
jgi:hypothetical protein